MLYLSKIMVIICSAISFMIYAKTDATFHRFMLRLHGNAVAKNRNVFPVSRLHDNVLKMINVYTLVKTNKTAVLHSKGQYLALSP